MRESRRRDDLGDCGGSTTFVGSGGEVMIVSKDSNMVPCAFSPVNVCGNGVTGVPGVTLFLLFTY